MSSKLRVGVAGPVGSGKTALVETLCLSMKKNYEIAVVTNDIYTKEDANAIIDHLNARFELESPINIHLTGCPNSCAQHYIGDIGMVGTAAEDGSEGYNVFVGGGVDHDQGMARFLCGPVASRDICTITESIVGSYLKLREDGESFIAFANRHDETALQKLLLSN